MPWGDLSCLTLSGLKSQIVLIYQIIWKGGRKIKIPTFHYLWFVCVCSSCMVSQINETWHFFPPNHMQSSQFFSHSLLVVWKNCEGLVWFGRENTKIHRFVTLCMSYTSMTEVSFWDIKEITHKKWEPSESCSVSYLWAHLKSFVSLKWLPDCWVAFELRNFWLPLKFENSEWSLNSEISKSPSNTVMSELSPESEIPKLPSNITFFPSYPWTQNVLSYPNSEISKLP